MDKYTRIALRITVRIAFIMLFTFIARNLHH